MSKHQWRNLDELADTPEFRQWLQREFPPLASEWPSEVSRRQFLKLMGASFALAGLNGCTRQPLEEIVPYVKQPEELIPGKPLYFATALTLGGYARGVLVESHEGRPTKIEGNPEHPASLGASDVFMQAEILALYDPDRSKSVMNGTEVATWDEFLAMVADEREKWKASAGAGLRLLTGHVTSPTLLDQIAALLQEFPAAKWHAYEPLAPRPTPPFYNLAKADVIVSIGEDFLGPGPAQLKYARDFARRRHAANAGSGFNRLYVAESTPTLTGAMADHRFALAPQALNEFGAAIATDSAHSESSALVLEDLRKHVGRSLMLVGDSLPNELRQFARDWNQPLQVAEPDASKANSLEELAHDLEGGKIETLVIIGCNPVYDAPADFNFGKKLASVPLRVRLGLYEDETSAFCQWHLSEAHALETWSDARAFDGTATIMQPLIQPLYGGKSAHELVAALAGSPLTNGYEIVHRFWKNRHPDDNFEKFWRRSLHDGVVAQTAASSAPRRTALQPKYKIDDRRPRIAGLELLIRPDPHIHDGRFSNNAWLQELPKPFTKLTWDNVALFSPTTAERLQLANEQVVELKYRGRSVRAPVWILPGQSDDCVTVHLGYGRERVGRVGDGVGFDAYVLRTADAPWGGPGLEIVKTDQRHSLATTQQHQSMEGRDLVRSGTLAAFLQNPAAIAQGSEPPPAPDESLYPPVAYKGHAWGMVIDLSTCIGCNACTIACQAENNIPVVGKEEVTRGREMHWIRVDNYFEGEPEDPRLHFQPVPCMHCENAPCELVCPVAATVHSSEGLNQMVYNRCIGTRYCSNNCPYKVRRFNFLEYDRNKFENAGVFDLLRNPDVTVRTRGVMEKCTYCVQRINRTRIDAENQNRPIRDGEIIPACAQACPAEAIVFGDINDPKSRVSKLKASELNYGLLAELNTRPRTTYRAKLRNPNPKREKA
jgi:molybdopterin-containing oxidoreductase family iron-sulfur binding subunit